MFLINLLIPFLRFGNNEVVDDVVIKQVKLAAEYAAENDMGLVPDLDVRNARRAFQSQYPDEMQRECVSTGYRDYKMFGS